MTDSLKSREPFLHDADVTSICLTISGEGFRVLEIKVHCHPDCGYGEWDNQKLIIAFIEPLVLLSSLFGHMANGEEINAIYYIVTEEMKSTVKELVDSGLRGPNILLGIDFHSGSHMDIACQEIQIAKI